MAIIKVIFILPEGNTSYPENNKVIRDDNKSGDGTMNIRKAEPADCSGIARVHVDAWHETYKGLISDEYLNSLSYDEKTERWRKTIGDDSRPERTLVIENESREIVGFAFFGPNLEKEYEYDADLHAIYLLRACQNQGLGSKLIKAAVKEMLELGYNSLIIWALKDNRYCWFYERLGGIKVEERLYSYCSQEVKLIGYGWKDIRTVLI
ncbi:MAG: GNAT family N-acetyltransferase [Bacillota bacterium]|nr:GNAT family N-acetyltransferase [Bacillota bacterium]